LRDNNDNLYVAAKGAYNFPTTGGCGYFSYPIVVKYDNTGV
jgi:hypothetical protein